MSHGCGCRSASSGVLDVRDLAPKLRYPKIFQAFDALEPGASFVLVNDHDPKPLLYLFELEPGSVAWRYLEDGPDVWRLEIARRLPAVTADQTVAEVIRRDASALEVMKRMGVNHCCGAHLSLREAAAAAGVPLDDLLSAVNETQSAR